jgi:hypothetical protein
MAYFFIIAGILLRLIPHLPNFAPIAAMALFGGVYLVSENNGMSKKYALIIPIVALFISDIIIGFYNPILMIAVYGSFTLIGLIGLWLRKHKNPAAILAATLCGSTLFFAITNFAVWAMPKSFYPHTIQGLVQCYALAIPFFRNTLLGDIFYTGLMFTLMEFVIKITSTWQLQKEANVISIKRVARKRI